MYFTDRGLEELADRRGEEQVTLAWLADQLQAFVDQFPDFEVPVERLATWLARGGGDPGPRLDHSAPRRTRPPTISPPRAGRPSMWASPPISPTRSRTSPRAVPVARPRGF